VICGGTNILPVKKLHPWFGSRFTNLKGAGLAYLSLVADKIEEPFVPEYWYPQGLGLALELIVVVESF